MHKDLLPVLVALQSPGSATNHLDLLLRRYRHLEAWLDLHGQVEERTGKVKPAANLAIELGRSLDRALDVLGMTPRSRARLGLDLVRTVDMATAMSEARP